MPSNSFKVIIIGGGPVGLTAAHALHLANIDFLVLERNDDVAVDAGASLVLGPQDMRFMQQLGLLDKLLSIGQKAISNKSFTKEGKKFTDSTAIQISRGNFGLEPLAFHRADLVRALLDALPQSARDKYLLSQKVVDVSTSDTGVVVVCANGKTYSGSMVLGADGVHSQTRKAMHRLSAESKFSASRNPEPPFSANYRCLWSNFPRPCEAGEATDTQGKDRCTMWITGRDRGWIFLYEKLPQPTTESKRYTQSEMDEFADSFADWPVNDKFKIKDVYNSSTAGMANLEEGILEHWSLGRIVLAGDSCHKFTPNAGLGFTNGIQDIALICNLLHDAVQASKNPEISEPTLQEIFQKYQAERKAVLEFDRGLSAVAIRGQSWANPIYWFLYRFLVPLYVFQWFVQTYIVGPRMKQSRVLSYVFGEDRIKGRIPWTYSIYAKGKEP
ncbi:FAD binding domain containing protein [Pyrenophora tritici-repentis]|uniref:UbiH, 2-polyprenyl-6-methoxyphenol hydroxylase and related FAD-dependent oxidoreductase n=3 Tax=Pyrenophora tritici-repentis TaxID=45151 RepID=A0A2W1G3D8_9PLEO|nr:FAD binding domain containing protein [Pyrenophora tritici-repentis Pt-1C-BFP]KAA8612436.1 FAD binding domain-containing protein [Pyrenophora tritici-repentis]EDU47694.1 FAD binding domain containing protein [Pyrenophora tritici-repentis Pt-1C-BFP]KAF7447037.1 FAD binding domain containing protein [Pyrenophora tritici-repentis]KAF7569328.1 UbiH, 2-polyprenyl-6-methoxyphenol hydroxylase and related FAD-dependent oxidoreductase [Pyrenophora tritici-repentis]KAG9382899.1 FAD binding domain con